MPLAFADDTDQLQSNEANYGGFNAGIRLISVCLPPVQQLCTVIHQKGCEDGTMAGWAALGLSTEPSNRETASLMHAGLTDKAAHREHGDKDFFFKGARELRDCHLAVFAKNGHTVLLSPINILLCVCFCVCMCVCMYACICVMCVCMCVHAYVHAGVCKCACMYMYCT